MTIVMRGIGISPIGSPPEYQPVPFLPPITAEMLAPDIAGGEIVDVVDLPEIQQAEVEALDIVPDIKEAEVEVLEIPPIQSAKSVSPLTVPPIVEAEIEED